MQHLSIHLSVPDPYPTLSTHSRGLHTNQFLHINDFWPTDLHLGPTRLHRRLLIRLHNHTFRLHSTDHLRALKLTKYVLCQRSHIAARRITILRPITEGLLLEYRANWHNLRCEFYPSLHSINWIIRLCQPMSDHTVLQRSVRPWLYHLHSRPVRLLIWSI